MISECPVNLECRLVDTLDFGSSNKVFVGEIVESYAEEKYLSSGTPDIRKIEPIVFSMYDNNYWGIREYLGKAWHAGKNSARILIRREMKVICREKAFFEESSFCGGG